MVTFTLKLPIDEQIGFIINKQFLMHLDCTSRFFQWHSIKKQIILKNKRRRNLKNVQGVRNSRAHRCLKVASVSVFD